MVFRRIKRKTTIFILVVFIYNTFGFLLIQPILSSYFEYFEIVKQEDRNSLIYFYWISDELENALEEDLQDRFDENSLNKKEITPDNNQSNTGYSEPVCNLIPEQINLPGSIYISYTSVHYLYICRDIPTPPPQLI